MAKPIRALELHYTMIHFLIKSNVLELYYFKKSGLIRKNLTLRRRTVLSKWLLIVMLGTISEIWIMLEIACRLRAHSQTLRLEELTSSRLFVKGTSS